LNLAMSTPTYLNVVQKKTLHFTKKQDLPQSNRSKDKFTNRTTIDVQLSDVMILLCKMGHESNLRPGLVLLTKNHSMRATAYFLFCYKCTEN
jgi:hypothetical protein